MADHRLTPHACSKRIRRKPAAAADQEFKRQKRNIQQQNVEDDGHRHRDWAVLPDLILHSLLGRLFLSADSSAPSTFASVCRSWHSFFATSKQCIVSTLPPLLLRPRWDAPSRAILFLDVTKKRPFVHEPFFDVLSTAFPQSKSQLRNDRLANSYICGFSHGYIITMDSRTNRPVLTDPFTGKDLWLFPPPPPNHFEKGAPPRKVQLAILTAAPRSEDCRIVLYSPTLLEGFWICKARSSVWSYRHLSITFGRPSQLILCRHKIYAITSSARIVIINVLFDLPIVKFLPEGCPRIRFFNVGPFITEFNGELLFIHCDPLNPLNPSSTFNIQVYRLSEHRLVRMESIGNCALFIETEGFVMARANPGRWGAKENHIYLTGPRYKSWKEVSVGTGLVDLPEFVPMGTWKMWPRPLWVLPSSCY
uniref:KIB1-4 beta-propeller domain-containing protein n=1 Tax=Ananas comosus var. bracteatus TaxID=296719 RepID=A0A6V7QCR7_ANACO|nr:unnamed protein product [Ananas comosus var. bracteatus]